MRKTAWPADAVERRPVDQLLPYARNAREHTPQQVSAIAASISEFGWTIPALVDEAGVLIAGHGRLLAAQKLGLADVPVMVARGWTEAQVKAYRLADNRLPLSASWDADLLRIELGDLQALDFDLSLTGFGDLELQGILAERTDGLTDPDDLPEPPPTSSQAGDVWLLGRHRLVCGDSTSADDVAKAINGVQPHLMVTDPPYGISYDAGWRSERLKDGAKRATGKVRNDNRHDWREAWSLFPGDVAYVWHGALFTVEVSQSLEACDFEIRSQIIWAKSRFAISRGHYHPQHEPCWYMVKKGSKGYWSGSRDQSTIWNINTNNVFGKSARSEDNVFTGHSTQKPVECMRRPIENNSSPGQAVYDPFSGSGTTIVAAEMTGRACHALEIDPAYVDLAVVRWMSFTGKQAILEQSGRTFGEVTADRNPGSAA